MARECATRRLLVDLALFLGSSFTIGPQRLPKCTERNYTSVRCEVAGLWKPSKGRGWFEPDIRSE